MLTLFTTGKPFRGHSGVIQRNALRSWTFLHPDVEIILFGDEEGAAEAARALAIRHVPHTERNENGRPLLNCLFDKANEIARHGILCYSNCDIILLPDFCRALEQVKRSHEQFLMVGRRWDTNITQPIDFTRSDWAEQTRERAFIANEQRSGDWIDYFAFHLGLYHKKIPPLLLGRVYWDNWLVWKAAKEGATVVDVSDTVVAIHQNHDYGYHPQGQAGVWAGEEARLNFLLVGSCWHLKTIESATLRLTERGIVPVHVPWHVVVRRQWDTLRLCFRMRLWHPLLNRSRPFRHALGIKWEKIVPAFFRRTSQR